MCLFMPNDRYEINLLIDGFTLCLTQMAALSSMTLIAVENVTYLDF